MCVCIGGALGGGLLMVRRWGKLTASTDSGLVVSRKALGVITLKLQLYLLNPSLSVERMHKSNDTAHTNHADMYMAVLVFCDGLTIFFVHCFTVYYFATLCK